MIATGRSGRHRATAGGADKANRVIEPKPAPQTVNGYEAGIKQLLEAWPMMPTALIAEQIGWDWPISLLRDRVVDLRTYYLAEEDADEHRPAPGELAHCGVWFPPVEVPVGGGQTRSAVELPVLTMITGHSQYLSALLLPSSDAEDLFAGCWLLLARLGAVPRILAWNSQRAVGRRLPSGITELTSDGAGFAAALGAKLIIGGTAGQPTRSLLERAHAHLERAFLAGRAFVAPGDFNAQLAGWLTELNNRPLRGAGRSPAELIAADKRAMLTLSPSATADRLASADGDRSASVRGVRVQLVFRARGRRRAAGRDHRRPVPANRLCDGRVAARHRRSWARNQTIIDPDHLIGHRSDAHGPAMTARYLVARTTA